MKKRLLLLALLAGLAACTDPVSSLGSTVFPGDTTFTGPNDQ